MSLNPQQERQLRDLKAHFPFRYCFAALHPETGDFQMFAMFNYPARRMRSLASKGYQMFDFGKDTREV